MADLLDLAKPFPSQFVKGNPNGFGDYVPHHIVTQRLLQVHGPYDFNVKEVLRGHVPATTGNNAKPALDNAVVGVICSLDLKVGDGWHHVDEVGDCENPQNWPHDGARLKDAMSDALKRCAMRFGLGLHLWSQRDYYLYDRLKEQQGPTVPGDNGQPVPVPTLTDEPRDAA